MTNTQQKPQTIDDYINRFSSPTQRILTAIKNTIQKTVPAARETISYGIPAFTLDGSYLVYFAAWKTYISIYPLPRGNAAFQKELSEYETTKGSVHFPLRKPIPYDFIEKIVRLHLAERR